MTFYQKLGFELRPHDRIWRDSSQCAGSASTTSRQICLSRESKPVGGSGRPCPGTRGMTESEAAGLRPRGTGQTPLCLISREMLAQHGHLAAKEFDNAVHRVA